MRVSRPIGLLAVLLAFAACASPASAELPEFVVVFGDDSESSDGKNVNPSAVPPITAGYDVVLRRRTDPARVSLTGVALSELLKAHGGIDVSSVPFVKVRFGDTANDSSIALVSLAGVDAAAPPMLMESGFKPGIGRWRAPSLVPGQPLSGRLSENAFRPFDARRERVAFIPARPEARLIAVEIVAKRKSNGEYLLTAETAGAPAEPLRYDWYSGYEPGFPGLTVRSSGKRISTTSLRSGRSKQTFSVVITSETTGSMGTATVSSVSHLNGDGNLRDPSQRKRKRSRR